MWQGTSYNENVKITQECQVRQKLKLQSHQIVMKKTFEAYFPLINTLPLYLYGHYELDE